MSAAPPPPSNPPVPSPPQPRQQPPQRRKADVRALAIVGGVVVVVLVVAVVLSRSGDGPDDDQPAQPDRPAGPTAEADFAMVLYEDPPGAETTDGFVLAGANRVAVEAVAHPETVTDDQGTALSPPAEHRFVAAKLAFETATSGPAAAGIALEVVDGDHRVDVTALLSQDGLFYTDGWVVTVEPADDEAPVLEVSYRGHTERLDLDNGERVGGSDALYEPLSVVLNHEVPDAEVPVTIPVPAPHPATVPVFGYTIARADLTAFEANRGWAPDGEAWLVVTIEGLGEPYLSDFDEPGLAAYFRFAPWESFTVEVDGEQVAPENAGPSADGAGMAVVFAVPDDLRSATLHAAPRWIMNVEGNDVDVTAPAVDLPIDL